MDNTKNDEYFLNKIIVDIEFVVEHTKNAEYFDIQKNEILLDSIMFRLIQISENANHLTDEFKEKNDFIKWRAIKGLRNRIVHDYGQVDLTIIYETVKYDLPKLLDDLLEI